MQVLALSPALHNLPEVPLSDRRENRTRFGTWSGYDQEPETILLLPESKVLSVV